MRCRVMPKAVALFLARTLNSSALHKHAQGLGTDVLYEEALRFWNLYGAAGAHASRYLEDFSDHLTIARARVGKKGKGFILPDGRWVTAEDLDAVDRAHTFLMNLYRRQLAQLRHQKGNPS